MKFVAFVVIAVAAQPPRPPPPHQKSNGPPLTLRDEADLLFCFLICLVKFPAREGNSRRRRVSSNPGN